MILGTLRAAVCFLTRVPVGSSPLRQGDLQRAPVLFPLVGGALGLVAAAVFSLMSPLGGLAAAVLAVSVTAFITGAFHEDGLADTADALGGSVTRERALEILKDSRIGSYGTVAMGLGLLGRVALLSELDAPALLSLVACHSLARLAPVWMMTHLPHAQPATSKSKDLMSVPRAYAYYATGIAAAVVGGAWWFEPWSPWALGASCLGVALVAAWFARLAMRRLGGITGDILGASEQVSEVVVLGVFVWIAA